MMMLAATSIGSQGSASFKYTLRFHLSRADAGACRGSTPKYRTAAR